MFLPGDKIRCIERGDVYVGVLGHIYTVEAPGDGENKHKLIVSRKSLHASEKGLDDACRKGLDKSRFELVKHTVKIEKGDTVTFTVPITDTVHFIDSVGISFTNGNFYEHSEIDIVEVKKAPKKIEVGDIVCKRDTFGSDQHKRVNYIFKNGVRMLIGYPNPESIDAYSRNDEDEVYVNDYVVVD